MLVSKIVKLAGFYVEVTERPIVMHDTGSASKGTVDSSIQQVGGIATIADKFVDASETVVAVCNYIREAFVTASRPDELKLKFGIKLGGEAGIPYVTKGTGEATIEIEATWKA